MQSSPTPALDNATEYAPGSSPALCFRSSARKCPSPSILCGKMRTQRVNASFPSASSGRPWEKPSYHGISSSSISGSSASSDAIVCSFSSGEKVHVEYSKSPPGRSIDTALRMMACCVFAHSSTFSRLQTLAFARSFRNIPSPEHGASTRILSNDSSNCSARRSGTVFVT